MLNQIKHVHKQWINLAICVAIAAVANLCIGDRLVYPSEPCGLKIAVISESIELIEDLVVRYDGVTQDHIWLLEPETPVGISIERINSTKEVLGSGEAPRDKDDKYSCLHIEMVDTIPIRSWSTVWEMFNPDDVKDVIVESGWYRIKIVYSLSKKKGSVCICYSKPFKLEKDSKFHLSY